eukprot:g6343.t1
MVPPFGEFGRGFSHLPDPWCKQGVKFLTTPTPAATQQGQGAPSAAAPSSLAAQSAAFASALRSGVARAGTKRVYGAAPSGTMLGTPFSSSDPNNSNPFGVKARSKPRFFGDSSSYWQCRAAILSQIEIDSSVNCADHWLRAYRLAGIDIDRLKFHLLVQARDNAEWSETEAWMREEINNYRAEKQKLEAARSMKQPLQYEIKAGGVTQGTPAMAAAGLVFSAKNTSSGTLIQSSGGAAPSESSGEQRGGAPGTGPQQQNKQKDQGQGEGRWSSWKEKEWTAEEWKEWEAQQKAWEAKQLENAVKKERRNITRGGKAEQAGAAAGGNSSSNWNSTSSWNNYNRSWHNSQDNSWNNKKQSDTSWNAGSSWNNKNGNNAHSWNNDKTSGAPSKSNVGKGSSSGGTVATIKGSSYQYGSGAGADARSSSHDNQNAGRREGTTKIVLKSMRQKAAEDKQQAQLQHQQAGGSAAGASSSSRTAAKTEYDPRFTAKAQGEIKRWRCHQCTRPVPAEHITHCAVCDPVNGKSWVPTQTVPDPHGERPRIDHDAAKRHILMGTGFARKGGLGKGGKNGSQNSRGGAGGQSCLYQ